MDVEIKYPWCGRKELSKEKKPLGLKLGTMTYFIHQECESAHRFHNSYSTNPLHPGRLLACNWSNLDTTKADEEGRA